MARGLDVATKKFVRKIDFRMKMKTEARKKRRRRRRRIPEVVKK